MNNFEVKQQLPSFVNTAAKKLRDAGFEAYLVGGSVRDILLGKEPGDYDIATNAYPDDIIGIFEKSIPTGAKFGTIIVLLKDEHEETQEIEVTTYRSEADYMDGRWPQKVEFSKTIAEDLKRRDFTINALALRLDDETLEQEDIVDLFGGIKDLKKGIVKAVGNPVERFSEDGLRALRACRLAANLGFSIESKTLDGIKESLNVVDNISAERVREELLKLLYKSPKPSIGFEYMREAGILQLILPELIENIGIDQPQYHSEDVYTHTLRTVDAATDRIKLAALFHDLGKARTMSQDEQGTHFYGHDKVGAEMTEEIMKRLKFSSSEIKRIKNLVRWHMFYYPNADWRKQQAPQTPEQPLQLYLLRAATTDYDLTGKKQGALSIELNERGKQEARQATQDLLAEGAKFDEIITSPTTRAKQSAEIVGEDLNLEACLDHKFAARDFGELQGLTWGEFTQRFPHLANYPQNTPQKQNYLPAGETLDQLNSRIKIGLFNLIRNHQNRNVLLVTHPEVIEEIVTILKDAYRAADLDIPHILTQITGLERGNYLKISLPLSTIDPTFIADSDLEKLEADNDGHPGGWSDAAVRRFIKKVGVEAIDELMELRIADALGNPKTAFNPKEIHYLSQRIATVLAEDAALKVEDLDINGKDLMSELGLQPSKQIGEILDYLLEQVIEEPLNNDRDRLLELAKTFIEREKHNN